MNTFNIDQFAQTATQMRKDGKSRSELAAYLQATIDQLGPETIIEALEAAVPPGASIGEMIVYSSDELTMLFARAPGRFESGIHNHTVCAVIGQLRGAEEQIVYETDGEGLREVERFTVRTGEVAELPKDVIHRIANPEQDTSCALHLYAGDLPGLADKRSLWDAEDHHELPFSFPALLKESAKTMRRHENQHGLDVLASAIPAAKPMIEAL